MVVWCCTLCNVTLFGLFSFFFLSSIFDEDWWFLKVGHHFLNSRISVIVEAWGQAHEMWCVWCLWCCYGIFRVLLIPANIWKSKHQRLMSTCCCGVTVLRSHSHDSPGISALWGCVRQKTGAGLLTETTYDKPHLTLKVKTVEEASSFFSCKVNICSTKKRGLKPTALFFSWGVWKAIRGILNDRKLMNCSEDKDNVDEGETSRIFLDVLKFFV